MNKPAAFRTLSRGEHSILRARPAWQSYWPAWVACGLIIGLWIIQRQLFAHVALVLGIPSGLSVVGLALGLAPILTAVALHHYTHSYEIENGRVLRTTVGLISRSKREYALSDKIQIDVHQSIAARILNYGQVAFWTGDDSSRMEWKNIADPDQIVAFLRKLDSGQPNWQNQQAKTGSAPAKASGSEVGSAVPAAPAHMARPVAGVTFSNQVVVLPRLPMFMAYFVGRPQPLAETYQWIERSQPLLSVSFQTTKDGVFKNSEPAEVIVPSPATGLLIVSRHDASDEPDPKKGMRTVLLPVSQDHSPDDAGVLYGALKDAIWHHRQYLFRDQSLVQQMKKVGGSKAELADRLGDDQILLEDLRAMCAQSCDVMDALPLYQDYFAEASVKWPHLRPLLSHLVDGASVSRVKEVSGATAI